jgi:hypothetical protein
MNNLPDKFKGVAGFVTGLAVIPSLPALFFSGHLPFMSPESQTIPNNPENIIASEELEIFPASTQDYSAFVGEVNNPNNDRAGIVLHTTVSDPALDERTPVNLDRPEMYAVGELSIQDGLRTGTCTLTYSESETHFSTNGNSIAFSAAHCVLDDWGNRIKESGLTASFEYVANDGTKQVFVTNVLDYFTGAYEDVLKADDRAVIMLSDPFPEEIRYAIMKSDYNPTPTISVNVIGRSGDKTGLHEDIDTQFVDFRSSVHIELKDCHASPGASGGAGSIGKINNHLITISTHSNGRPGENVCGEHVYTSDFLDSVSFLSKRPNPTNVEPDVQKASMRRNIMP